MSALQAGALISKLTEEKNSAIQQNHRLRQELVSEASHFIYLCYCIADLYHECCNFRKKKTGNLCQTINLLMLGPFFIILSQRKKSQNSCSGNPYIIGYFTPCLILLEQQEVFTTINSFFSCGELVMI